MTTINPTIQRYLLGRYERSQNYQAARGVPFLLNFDEYVQVWRRCNKLKELERLWMHGILNKAIYWVLTRRDNGLPFTLENSIIVSKDRSKLLGRIKKGERHGDAARQKMRKPKTDAHKANISKGRTGKGCEPKSEEQRQRISASMKAHHAQRRARAAAELAAPTL